MSYFNPKVYNRNNVKKYCPDADREAVWGMDWQRYKFRSGRYDYSCGESATIAEKMESEIALEIYDQALIGMTYDAMELIVSVLDNLDEDVELDEIPEEDIIWSFVDDDCEESKNDAFAAGCVR